MAFSTANSQSWALVARVIRYVLLAFSFALFISSCVALGKLDYWHGRTGVSLVTSLFGFFWYIPTILPNLNRLFSPAIVLAGDIWLFLWWIIALGVLGDVFGGDLSCSWYSYHKSGCNAGKAGLAFAALGFVVSFFTLGLVSYFAVYKSYRAGGKSAFLEKGTLLPGNIFLADGGSSTAAGVAADADIEAGAGAASSGPEEVTTDHKDVDSQPTEHSPAGSRKSHDEIDLAK